GATDETAVLPRVPAEGPEDRVPPGFFRDERGGAGERGAAAGSSGSSGSSGSDDRTRELPRMDPEDGAAPRRPRPDWAEETPLDDLPTLADELLGPREDDGEPDDGRGRRGGRGGRR
ncbi:hypothetical protein, partial [Streptomyces sp. NPDC003697]